MIRALLCSTIGVALCSLLSACSDTVAPLQPQAADTTDFAAAALAMTGGALPSHPPLNGIITAVLLDPMSESTADEFDDQELVQAVRSAGGRVFIGFKSPTERRTRDSGVIPGTTRDRGLASRRALETHGVSIVRTFRTSATVVAEIDPEAAPYIRKLPFVNFVEPVQSVQYAQGYVPQDTAWGLKKVRAHNGWAWSSPYNAGQAAWITMIDGGVDYGHLIAEQGDGPAGLNFSECLYVPGPGVDDCFDRRGHGSHVAGILSGRDNPWGMIGIAHLPRGFTSIKVCHIECTLDALVGAIDHAVWQLRTRHIINISMGTLQNASALQEVVGRAHNFGVIIVAAVGNWAPPLDNLKTQVTYPARYNTVIGVSGTLENDQFAGLIECPSVRDPTLSASRYGTGTDLSAPYFARSMVNGLDYDVFCGTSMATPVVSGVAALVWTKWPSWTHVQVRDRLQATAVDLGTAGWDPYFGHGRVDAVRALNLLDPSALTAGITGPTYIESEGSYSWQASAFGGAGSYTYAWHRNDGWGWQPAGAGQMYYAYVGSGTASFWLQVTVTSGGQQAVSPIHTVTVTAGCGSGGYC